MRSRRQRGRRWARILAGAVLLVMTTTVVWTAVSWPSPRLLLLHGRPGEAGPRPTGREAVVEGIEFVEISRGYYRAGSRTMRAPGSELGRVCLAAGLPCGRQPATEWGDWPPGYREIAAPVWISRTEITERQWNRLRHPERAPARPGEEETPVDGKNWLEAAEFARDLGRATGMPLRLPREVEWECACRAGTATEYWFGDDPARLSEVRGDDGWGWPARVQSGRPNPWALFDLHGNLSEWCVDEWDGPLTPFDLNPGPGYRPRVRMRFRVVRGGGIYTTAELCRSASRRYEYAGTGSNTVGFRLAFTLGRGQERLVDRYLAVDR